MSNEDLMNAVAMSDQTCRSLMDEDAANQEAHIEALKRHNKERALDMINRAMTQGAPPIPRPTFDEWWEATGKARTLSIAESCDIHTDRLELMCYHAWWAGRGIV